MLNKKLGVVGGMGPLATSIYFERVIQRTAAMKDQEHIDMIILNHASLPDRTQAILENAPETFLNMMQKDLSTLEQLEVSNIAIPCNTAHYYIEALKEMTRVPIINMVEETVNEVEIRYGKNARVGILATNGTIFTGTYERACDQHGLVFVKPAPEVQAMVMATIYDIKADKGIDVSAFEAIVSHMIQEENCHCVILACTELSLIKLSDAIKSVCVDAMDILVEKSIVYSGKKLKP